MFGPNDLRPTIFRCQATDSIPPHEVKYDGGVVLPIHDFLFGVSSNTLPNLVPLQPKKLRNVNHPDFDLLRSLNVQS